jgi:iron complex outermembrane receptor protein
MEVVSMPKLSSRIPLCTAVLIASSSLVEAQNFALEEVIVTAQKREQSLMDVPVSVTAISGDSVVEGDITHMEDVAAQTPNFTKLQFNIGEPQYSIRGISSSLDSAASDPAVASFVDEVYMGRTGGSSTDLFDIERIEVLRGPQGTIFGKNVVGGAISTHTRKPVDEFEASVSGTVGNEDLTVLQGMVNVPLGDTAAGRLVFSKRDRDGYIKNVLDGKDYQEQDNLSIRGSLRFDPTDDLTVLWTADYSDDDVLGNCRNVNNLTLNDPAGISFTYPPVIEATTGGDWDKCASSVEAFQEREVKGTLVRIDWHLENMTFTSLTAYREMEYEHLEDLAAMPIGETSFNLVDTVQEESEQISQEFRLASDGNENFNWLLGAFYMKEEVDRAEQFIGTLGPPLAPGPASLLDGHLNFTQDAETTSWAVFAQVDYAFNEAWSLTLGGRYSYDEKEIVQGMLNLEDPARDTAILAGALDVPPAVIEAVFAPEEAVVLGIPGNGFGNLGAFVATGDTGVLNFPYSAADDDDWSETTLSASVNWNYSDEGLLYFTFSEGYKSGSYNSSSNNQTDATLALDPETATNYELGWKTQFLDNRIRFNASVFSMDYDDLQVYRLVGSLLVGANAQATSEGVELELTALATENWTISGNYSYLDAEYDTFTAGEDDLGGNSLTRAPENTVFIRSSYVTQFSGGSEIDWVVSYNYVDEYFFDPENHPSVAQPSHELWNASATWYSADQNWVVSLWGKNLADEEYIVHTIRSNVAGTVDVWAPPRTYGLTANYKF